MKAVVVDIKGSSVAVLSDDGCIIKLQNNDYVIGQVMELKERTTFKAKKLFALAASAAAAVIVLSVGAWAYYTPYSYVSLDVNPSIGYSVNRFDKVIGANAVNGDGADILSTLNLKYKKIDNAINETVDKIAEKGYFKGSEPGGIMITTSSSDTEKAEKIANRLKEKVTKQTKNISENIQLEVENVALERVQQASELGITPGKLNLIEKLQKSAVGMSSISINQWVNAPVKDIMKATKEFKETAKAVSKDTKAEAKNPQADKNKNKVSDSSAVGSSSSSIASSKAENEDKNSNAAAASPVKGNEKKNENADKIIGSSSGTVSSSSSAAPPASSESIAASSSKSQAISSAGSEKPNNGSNNKSDSSTEKSNNGNGKK